LKAFVSKSWAMSWPMTLIMFFEFLIGLTDVYVAGRVGKEVQAAYGFIMQLYFVMIVTANALTVGTVSVVSRLFSAGRREDLAEVVFSSVTAAVIAGSVLAIGGFFLAAPLVKLLNIPPELRYYVVSFNKIYAAGLLFHYVLINGNGLLRSCNRVKQSLKTMAIVCCCNIGLNFFLVFHTPLGYRGIATATATSVFIGSLVNWTFVRVLLENGKRFSLQTVKTFLGIGWPIGLLQILWQLSSTALFLILSLLPENRVEILAALTAGLRVESAIYLPAIAFNMANAVVVGNLLGNKRQGDAFKAGMVTAGLGVAIVTVLVVGVILNARWIVSLLSNNGIVINESVKYLYISMISEPFMAWGVILAGGLSGAGDTRSVLLRVALSVWLVRIPLCYVAVVTLGFGAVYVWWAMNVSQFVQTFLISKRYFGKRWLDPWDPGTDV
jgi:multidrug resistance protein, MATE family